MPKAAPATQAAVLPPHISNGNQTGKIPVKISYRIIELFSDGLYSSPNKAIEELVTNSFDAGAKNVHVVISPDLTTPDSAIVVADDGTSMDPDGFRQHWLIGVSKKRSTAPTAAGRKQIGKFGIGKLATFVLANHLTHICRTAGKYYAVSMDYSKIPQGQDGGIHTDDSVELPLRELSEKEAREAIEPLISGSLPGHKALKFFGKGAPSNWTVAIMSGLKPMATEIQRGRLQWILRTAMPLRDDFKLFLDGQPVLPSRAGKANKHWILGKDLKEIPHPSPEDITATEKADEPKASLYRHGLTHPQLGRITGYVETYDELLTETKSAKVERSHGFFVYVHGRLINIEDEYFGIDSNSLRHGTFARFRMVVHIDKLDQELRSSRETVREGVLTTIARNILHGAFNFARQQMEARDTESLPGTRAASRASASPGSLTSKPLLGIIDAALSGKYQPRYFSVPGNLSAKDKLTFSKKFEELLEKEEGKWLLSTEHVDLAQSTGLAIFDIERRVLQINTLHPFVAYFSNEFENQKRNLPLELFAISEVLLEAHLLQSGVDGKLVADILLRRDDLMRHLARNTGKRNATIVAQDLRDAATNKAGLERELVSAFDSMGFDAVPKGGPNKPDGIADAPLPANSSGAQRYKVSLEAKSKEELGKKVSAKSVGVSGIVRQRDDFQCDHALVVGPDFPTTQGDKSALAKEIETDRKTGKTITLIRVDDLARLVRLVPARRIGLGRLRELFRDCTTPEESKAWVDKIEKESPPKSYTKEILAEIWQLAKETPSEPIEYGSIVTGLRIRNQIQITRTDLEAECKALARMAPGHIFASNNSVELGQRPDIVLKIIGSIIQLDSTDGDEKAASKGKAK